MNAANNKILVRCDESQKNYCKIGGVLFKMALNYNPNYRERSPVIAEVIETKGEFGYGDMILAHHNHFYQPSPYWLQDDLFSIPCNKTIFAIIQSDGSLKPVCGNILGEQFYQKHELELPPDMRKKYNDRIVCNQDTLKYKKQQLIFTRPYAPYEIVYTFNDIEHRVVKVDNEMVVGYIK